MSVVFDSVDDPRLLPHYIAIHNSNGTEEVRIDVHQAWANGQFNGNTLDIYSEKLTPGIKIVKSYQKASTNRKGQSAKTERILIPQ